MLELFLISSWGPLHLPGLSWQDTACSPVPHAAGEPEVEVVQRVVLVRGAAAGQRQAGDLAAQPVPALQVQGAVGPVLLPSREAGVVDGHVGYTGGRERVTVRTFLALTTEQK